MTFPDGFFDPVANTYTDGTGQKVVRVHPFSQCQGRPCAIHAPSDHNMRSWPTHLRIPGMFDIKQLHMERICPHGIGHPDPDDAAYHRSLGPNMSVDVHGCDGCCETAQDNLVAAAILEELEKPEANYDGPAMSALISSLQDDLMDADAYIENLRDQLASLSASYEFVQDNRNFWRDMANESKSLYALMKTFTFLEILEEDATTEKRQPYLRSDPEMHYQQGKADAYRIAMATMQEHFHGEIPV